MKASGATSAADLAKLCGTDTRCIVPANTSVSLEASLNVVSLIVRGKVTWTDQTQTATEQWLCAGFVAVEPGGSFLLRVHQKSAFVYIKDNGEAHAKLRTRAFGGIGSTVKVEGRPMARTWSLLAEPAPRGATSITLMHNPIAMGWRVGDRLLIAPTTRGSKGNVRAV